MSFDRLQKRINELKNPTVVGLDPALDNIPPEILNKHIEDKGETLAAAAGAVYEFNTGLIDAIYDIVPAIKAQSAFYELLGPEGVIALKMTFDYAKSKGIYVINDAKRNDIGPTAIAYSGAYLGTVKIGEKELHPFDVDAMTLNAYLGTDGIMPFIADAIKYDKAMFVLVKTSNPSSGELQDRFLASRRENHRESALVTGGGDASGVLEDSENEAIQLENDPKDSQTLYTTVADLMEEISKDTIGDYGFTRVGAVVGATYPEEMKFLRSRLKNTFFLVPGYGAQGGSAADAALAFQDNGQGAIVNSSRGIIAAWKQNDQEFKNAARTEALRMKDELSAMLF